MGVSSTEIIDPDIALYVYKNTLEKGKFEPMRCLASESIMFVCGSKKPVLELKFICDDIDNIVSLKIFVKKGFLSEEPYLKSADIDDNFISAMLESGKCYSLEFVVKYPNGERETIKRTYDLRGETALIGDISVEMFGVPAGRLKSDPILKAAVKKMEALNKLLPKGLEIRSMHVFSTTPGNIGSAGIAPRSDILPVCDTIFTSFGDHSENERNAVDVVTHEYGHVLTRLSANYSGVDFDTLFEKAKINNIIGLFCDGSYSANERLGHPWDEPDELFASGFTVLSNYPEVFRARMNEEFYSDEQRSLIREVADYVYLRCYGRPFFDK